MKRSTQNSRVKHEVQLNSRRNVVGVMGYPTQVKFEFRKYYGGRYVECGLTLHYIPNTNLEIESNAVWPESDNYDDSVIETIRDSCLRENFLGRFVIEEIMFHPVNSSLVGFKQATSQAINSIISLSRNDSDTFRVRS